MKQIILLCSTVFLLSGCHIYKPYHRPEVQTDGLYGPDVQATDTASIATLPWTALFTDPWLQNLIREGLAATPTWASPACGSGRPRPRCSRRAWPTCPPCRSHHKAD